jgi:hypothetical protein
MTKPSEETKAKRAASMRARWADPEYRAALKVSLKASAQRLQADPEKAAAFAARSSERMKRRHQDPEWQIVRNARSSRVGKANWAHPEIRERLTEFARHNYAKLHTDAAKLASRTAAKWILKQAWAEMLAATEYANTYRDVQAEMRMKHPYDGPQDSAAYSEHCQRIGRLVVTDQRLKDIQFDFMRDAIPRWADAWKKKKEAA